MPKLGNLASRLAVAVVAVPILLLAIYQHQPVFVWAIVFAASLVAMYEFFAMTLEDVADRRASLVAGAASVLALYWLPEHYPGSAALFYLLAIFIAFVPIVLYYLFRLGDIVTAATRIAFSVTGIVYCGFLATFIAFIKRDFGGEGGNLIVLLLLVAWLADTGAYVAGRLFGRNKLYPAVSPKKTWEGAIGGVTGSLVGGAFVKICLIPHIGWTDIILIAAVGSVLGQLGDLSESLIKRSRGVKDSGNILPGHGGILDRIDAVLFIAPYIYLYMQLRAFWS